MWYSGTIYNGERGPDHEQKHLDKKTGFGFFYSVKKNKGVGKLRSAAGTTCQTV